MTILSPPRNIHKDDKEILEKKKQTNNHAFTWLKEMCINNIFMSVIGSSFTLLIVNFRVR